MPLAIGIGLKLCKPVLQLLPPRLGPPRLFRQLLGEDGEPLQRGTRGCLGVAQRLQGLVGHEHDLLRFQFNVLRVGKLVDQLALLRFGFLFGKPRRHPADMEQRRFGLADFPAQRAIADGKPRLPLQRFQLLLDLADDVVDTLEVLFGRLQPEFGLVPPRMQPRNARRLFEQRAARLRLGGDQLADLSLPHQRR